MTQKLGRYPLNNQTSIGLSRKRYNWRLLRILVWILWELLEIFQCLSLC